MSDVATDLDRFPATDNLVLLRVYDQQGELRAVLPNHDPHKIPVRVLHGLQDRDAKVNAERAQSGLQVLAKTGDDKGNQVADLLHALQGQDSYTIAVVASPVVGLLDRIHLKQGSKEDVSAFVDLLNAGDVRAAEKVAGLWTPFPFVIHGILNYFGTMPNQYFEGGWWDKIPLKTASFTEAEFEAGGVRYAPGCQVRTGAYIGAGTVLMNQAYVNIGAYIAGEGVMIDVASRVASCAQVGKNVKFGAGSGIEGVLEPAGRLPSIIEDNVKIGAMVEVSGIVGEGSVLASGVVMASGKKILDEATGELIPPHPVTVGETTFQLPVIPPYRLAVGGSIISENGRTATDAILLKAGDLRDRDTLKHFEKQGVLYS